MFTSFNSNTLLVLVWILEGGTLAVVDIFYFVFFGVRWSFKFVVNRSICCASYKIIENRQQETTCQEKLTQLFKSLTGKLIYLWIHLEHFILPCRPEVEH